MKGTLHFHIIVFGGISTYVLQQFSSVQKMCDKIVQALDSFSTAKLLVTALHNHSGKSLLAVWT